MTIVIQLTLSTSFQTVTTIPDASQITISTISLVNTDSSSRIVKLCLVPPGNSALQTNALLWDFAIAANDFIEIGSGQIVLAKYTIQALASTANVVNLRLSGT